MKKIIILCCLLLPIQAQAITLEVVVNRMGDLTPLVVQVTKWVMYVCGIFTIGTAINDSIKATSHQGSNITKGRITSRFVFGAVFMALGYIVGHLTIQGLTGLEGWNSGGIYDDTRASDNIASISMLAVMRLVQLFGFFAIIKGLLLWKATGDGRDQAGQGDKIGSGFIHIGFGAILLNIIEFYTTVAYYFGFSIPAFFPKAA